MLRVISIFIVLSPLSAWAVGGTPGNKPTSTNYAQQQQNRSGAFAWIKRNLIPSWKQRFLQRREQLDLWNKPSGGHFTTPTPRPSFIKRTIIVARQRFQSLRASWRARWKNRHVDADKRTALQNQAGFGTNVRRPHKHVAYSWRTRFDRGKRLRPKPVAMNHRRSTRPKRFTSPPVRRHPRRRHRRPPPPSWKR
jgi:hypothetical protein